jgi:hypothetical protein
VVGAEFASRVGNADGVALGCAPVASVGLSLRIALGSRLGCFEGATDGYSDASSLGVLLGWPVPGC